MNKVILIGRWTKDIDFKALESGKSLSKSSIAIDDGYGEKKQTYFFDVEMWGKTAEAVANFSGKGKRVAIEGRLKVDTWEKDGQKRSAVKIIADQVEFLESNKDGSQRADKPETDKDPFTGSGTPISDDDLPF